MTTSPVHVRSFFTLPALGLLLGSCCGCPGGAAPETAASANATLGSAGVASVEPYQFRNVVILGGGFVTGVVFSQAEKDLVYARTDIGGAYRLNATDGTWIPITDFLGPEQNNLMGIESLAADPTDPNRVYLATGTYTQSWAGTGAMLRSTDRGASWEVTPLDIKMGGNENGRGAGERLVVDPNRNDTLLFGTRKYGLWRSDDAGKSWSKGSFPHDEEELGVGITFVLFDKESGKAGEATQVVYAGWAGKEANLFVSRDGAKSWEPVPGQPKGMIPNHAGLDSAGVMYLSYGNSPGPNDMTHGALFKFDTKSGKWTDVTPLKPKADDGFGYGGCSVLPSAQGHVLAVTLNRWGPGDDAFLTTDGGKTWRSVLKQGTHDDAGAKYLYWGRTGPEGLSKSGWMADVDLDPWNPARASYVTGQGVWLSTTLGTDAKVPAHWKFENRGLEETAVNDLASPPSGPPLLSALGDLGGFRHDDLGVSPVGGMFQNPIYGNGSSLDFAELKPETVVVAGTRSYGSQATRGSISHDGGKTFVPFATEPAGEGAGNIVVSADGKVILWAPKNGAVARSIDEGKTWEPAQGLSAPPKLPDWAPVNFRLSADRVNPMKAYVYDATSGSVFASMDAGATFTESKSGLPAKPEYELVPTGLEAVPGHEGQAWASTGKELYRTTDSGATWQSIDGIDKSAGIGFGKGKAGASYPAVYIIAHVNEVYGVYRSDDEGRTWVRINTTEQQFGGPNRVIGDPRVYGRVYLGTHGRGILVGEPQ